MIPNWLEFLIKDTNPCFNTPCGDCPNQSYCNQRPSFLFNKTDVLNYIKAHKEKISLTTYAAIECLCSFSFSKSCCACPLNNSPSGCTRYSLRKLDGYVSEIVALYLEESQIAQQ